MTGGGQLGLHFVSWISHRRSVGLCTVTCLGLTHGLTTSKKLVISKTSTATTFSFGSSARRHHTRNGPQGSDTGRGGRRTSRITIFWFRRTASSQQAVVERSHAIYLGGCE